MLGKIKGRKRKGHQRIRWLCGIIDAMNMNLGKYWEKVKDREAQSVAVHRVTKSRTRLSDWTTTMYEGHLPVRPDFMVGESGVIIPTATGCGNEIKCV